MVNDVKFTGKVCNVKPYDTEQNKVILTFPEDKGVLQCLCVKELSFTIGSCYTVTGRLIPHVWRGRNGERNSGVFLEVARSELCS